MVHDLSNPPELLQVLFMSTPSTPASLKYTYAALAMCWKALSIPDFPPDA